MKKERRSLHLIADFEKGYAKGWYFAVGECFRDELDMKWTKRTIKKKAHWEWTQGRNFAFSEGDVIYDTPLAYEIWEDALKVISLRCEVIRPTSDELLRTIKNNDRSLTFTLSRPNPERTGLERISSHTMKQRDFVAFLKSGPGSTIGGRLMPRSGWRKHDPRPGRMGACASLLSAFV